MLLDLLAQLVILLANVVATLDGLETSVILVILNMVTLEFLVMNVYQIGSLLLEHVQLVIVMLLELLVPLAILPDNVLVTLVGLGTSVILVIQ